MPSKKTTPPSEPGSTAAGSSANKKPETPASPPSASAPAKKRTGKGAKAAPSRAASQPSDKAETQAAPETLEAAPEGASSYPFPPPPEALPWEGVGDALPKRKDQLEINRREREKLAELLGAGESRSASGPDAAPLQEKKAESAPSPEVPVFLGNSQKKKTPSTAKEEKPSTAESRVVSPAKKSPSESNASTPSKDSGTPKKPKAQKPTQKAEAAGGTKAVKPKTKTKKESRMVESAAAPQAMACFRKAESPAAEAQPAPVEPAAASGNESRKDAPIQNVPDAAQTPASPEPTRLSSGRSGVFGASLGRGLQELSNELPQEPSDKASGTTAPTFVDAPGEDKAKPAGPDAAPDAPHFIALEGRRKNLDSIEKPHEPMRELFPSGTHELLKEMADPDWKEKFLAESLALRDQLEEEAESLAIRKAAATVPLVRTEELSRARIECEAVEGERPRLLLTDHPDILAVFPDDAGDAYLALLLREISRLESRAREIANINPADPRLPGILKAFEEVLEAALPAFQEKVRGIDARMRILKEAGAAAFLRDDRASEPFRPDGEASGGISRLMDALARISRGEFPPRNAKEDPTPTSLWLEALGSVGEPHSEKAPGGDIQAISRAGSPRTSMNSPGALTESARSMPPAPAPDGGPANAPGRSVKSFLFRPASYLGAIASACLCAAIVPKLISAVFPTPAFAVVDNDFVRERVALLRIAHTRPGMPEREDLKALDGDRIDEAIRLVSESNGLPVLDARTVLSGTVSSGNTRDLTDDVFARLGIRPEELRVLDAALKEGWAADLSNLAESGSVAPSLLMQKAREAEANPPMPHSDHDFMDRVKRTLKFFGSPSIEASKGEAP